MAKQQTTNKPAAKTPSQSYSSKIIKKAVSLTRQDISNWRIAIQKATATREPKRNYLKDIYNNITLDALLSSQINNRHEQTIAAPFIMVAQDGKQDEQATVALAQFAPLQDIIKEILNSEMYGYSLVELTTAQDGQIKAISIPRQNIVPDYGLFYPDITQNTCIEYRKAREYGAWLMEFDSAHLGLLNKAVCHVLFKKFAQSCWSELCEIFGIPPRYMKTNTQDQGMLNRAEAMMKDLGAAAWFIIDSTEEFQFAQGVSTNGDVYNNLIRLCNNEVSMLISGAIVGQDTENGNYSKEQVAVGVLDRLINSDKRMVETYMNAVVIPALCRTGFMPATTAKFQFTAAEDSDKLWQYTQALLPYKDIDNQWITEKFGIPVKDKTFNTSEEDNLSFHRHDTDFFV